MTQSNPPIVIRLNGQQKMLGAPGTLRQLLSELALQKEKVVIELNLDIVPKEEVDTVSLKNGDEIEIVHFVGGGAVKKTRAASGRSSSAHSDGHSALVIVESPTKCKTIHKYLGPGFEIAASMGHVIDLPKSKMGIDIENNFEPRYVVVKDRKKTLSELKAKARNKKKIYLACDPDREGEAISWHLKNELGDGKQVSRVVFNEITREAVLEAFKHPSDIDMNLVGAQQARRVLDRLVGYNLSPLLWQKVGRGLSAGRVQSVALRLIVDQERKIQAFVPVEYWTIEADLKKQKGEPRVFRAKLEKIAQAKAEIHNKAAAEDLLGKIKTLPFVVSEIRRQKKKRNPTAPFTTSKLQQAAYNQLRFPAYKTMKVAQMLYEGIEIGKEGSVGLITYMRTDSVRISATALKETCELVRKQYGNRYLPETPNVYRSKKGAQEAHEAIRPASVSRKPQDIEKYLTPDQYKLYSLIWAQTVASQMAPAVIAQETADIAAGEYLFRATGSRVDFPGFLAVTGRAEVQDNPLPDLKPGERLDLVKLENEQHFTKPPARFTDASLVKALEEKGIGRPSTYAPIIMTLIGRNYIRREGGSMLPTELGILVTDLLVKYFSKVLDYKFTATMEEELDNIEEGRAEWVGVVRSFYGIFSSQLEVAKDQMKTVKRESEPTNEICEQCGRPMVIKWGRRGRFMSCSGWPDCRNSKSISTDVTCPRCKTGKLVMKRARSGRGRPFYGCTRYSLPPPDQCTYIANRLPSSDSASAEVKSAAGVQEAQPDGADTEDSDKTL